MEDNSEWWVLDEAECPGLGMVELNRETVMSTTKPLRTDLVRRCGVGAAAI